MNFFHLPFAALLFALASCAPAEPVASPDPGAPARPAGPVLNGAPGEPIDPDVSMTASQRAACEAAGGFVERRGRRNAELCVTPFPDAGTICRDGSECQGDCIVEGSVQMQTGGDVGICQRDDALFGCFGTVENGAILRGLCVD